MSRITSLLCAALLCLVFAPHSAAAQAVNIYRVASGLQNPRGAVVLPDGRLLLAEAGTGRSSGENTGRLSLLYDHNLDDDYDDAGERIIVVDRLPGYNILQQFNPGRDEVVGVGDLLALPDGRIFYTLDDHFETLSVIELTSGFSRVGHFYRSGSTLNALAYDANLRRIYIAESTSNLITAVTLDGESRTIVTFGLLAHRQQAVPAGLAVDPLTGELVVALFSGQLWDYYGELLSFMPGDAKVVRVNPQTGAVRDAITDLTTAVDVATDENGNIYVVEMTTEWPSPTLSYKFDLYNPVAPPDAGGYVRYSGRVSLYPASGGERVILADDLDAPTNITYHDGTLYVSAGQGTPGRPIWVSGERRTISGALYKITLSD